MPEAQALECPECGAKLTPEPGAVTVRCAYCGTTSQVGDLGPHPDAGSPASSAREAMHQAEAVAKASAEARREKLAEAEAQVAAARAKGLRGMVAVLVVVGLVIGAVSLFGGDLDAIVTHFNKTGHLEVVHAAKTGPTKSGELVQWDDLAPSQLGRVPGGRTVLLGLTRHLLDHKTHIVAQAFDAATLGFLWESRPLGLWTDYQVIFARIAAGKAILTDDHGRVLVLDLATGHQTASRFLEDRAKDICVPDPARPQAWIETADGRGHALDVATGKVVGAPRPAGCVLGCTGGPVWEPESAGCRHLDQAPKVDGLQVTDLVKDGAAEVALGHRSQGTKVPMAAGFDTATGKLRWKRTLPDGDAFSAKEDQTIGLAAAGAGAAYFVLDMKEGPARLIALDEATGRTLWTVKVPREDRDVDEGELRFAHGRLYLAHGVALDVLDARTGKLQGTLGEL